MPDTLIEVRPDVLRWAVHRSGHTVDDIRNKVPKLEQWLTGQAYPSLGDLEKLAKATYTPVGNFFLKSPPNIELGLTDFRTIGNVALAEPSPNLVDTLAMCEQRQDWYREYALENGFEPVAFVGSLDDRKRVSEAAAVLRSYVDFEVVDRSIWSTGEMWGALATAIEDAGILVMKNGVVGNNSHRALDPAEFRGFALADDIAPLIFVNGKDARAATVFTLVHELVHIGLGLSSISNFSLSDQTPAQASSRETTEQWCSAVAAEFLVPVQDLLATYQRSSNLSQEIERLSRRYKVSGFVIARKLRDDGLIDWDTWRDANDLMLDAWRSLPSTGPAKAGGDMYRTLGVRVGKSFAQAIVVEVKAGNTLYSEALRLLGLRKAQTLDTLAERLGVA